MSKIIPIEKIEKRIYFVREQYVMVDRDLSQLYGVETRVLNQAVKRNMGRFPGGFMFQLTKDELKNLKSQTVISSWGGRRKLPIVFTEQGVAMLSAVLKSKTAVQVREGDRTLSGDTIRSSIAPN